MREMTDERRRKIIENAIRSTRRISDRADEVVTESRREGNHITYTVRRKSSSEE